MAAPCASDHSMAADKYALNNMPPIAVLACGPYVAVLAALRARGAEHTAALRHWRCTDDGI
jgi:hypothetical protein